MNRTIRSTLLNSESGKRLQLQRDLHAERFGLFGQPATVFDTRLPLLGGRNHLAVPDVFAQHQQQVSRLQLVDEIEIGFRSLEMESLHARIEIDQTDGHATHRNDRQLLPPTFVRISRRSRTSISSGSAKMSIVSKPISFVRRIPQLVSRPA